MNLRYLHYLRLVVEQGSFAAAARMAGVSQPAISHAMNQLQQSFDTPLFVVSGRRRVPTPAALRAALKGTDLAEGLAAISATRGPIRSDTLRVGVTPSAALVCGAALYASWCLDQPRRRLDMSGGDEGRLLARLQGGDLDLVISPLPRRHGVVGLTHQPLYSINPLAYARRAHPLRKAQTLAQLQAAPWAIVGPSVKGPVDVLHEAFAVRRMRPPSIAASCPDYASLLQLVAHTDLLCVLPHAALLSGASAGELVPLRLREALPLYQMHLFTPSRPRPSLKRVLVAFQEQLGRSNDKASGLLLHG
jgi:DNA-binding transcriptional LysR family regulator